MTSKVPKVSALAPIQWLYHLVLHGTHDFGGNLAGIPEGVYQIGLEIASTAECGDGAHLPGAFTTDYASGRPVMNLWWDEGRGAEPTNLATSPEGALRDLATGSVAAWRVLPIDSRQVPKSNTGTIYHDVPVKVYVAETTIRLDFDGNVIEDYKQVHGVELCTGEVHQLIDQDHPSPGLITTTCDETHADEVTLNVSSDPDGSWVGIGTYDGPLGISVGVTRAPSEGGSYYLVAEPLDEAFRRGDSWKVDHGIGWPKPVVRFTVMGGVFLDEQLEPLKGDILVGSYRDLFLRLLHSGSSQTLNASVAFVTGGTTGPATPVTLNRVGSSGGSSLYLGYFSVRTPGEQGAGAPPNAVEISGVGDLVALVDGESIATAPARQVWAEIEKISDKDGNDVTGLPLDAKRWTPIKIRYRIMGTDQLVNHMLTEIAVDYDPQDPVLASFYGTSSQTISEVSDQFPDVIINGFYESEWDGRDNTSAQRLLLRGTYYVSVGVTLQGVGVVRMTAPHPIEISPPSSTSYGPNYPDHATGFAGPNDFSSDSQFAADSLATLWDGSHFLATGGVPVSLFTSSQARARMLEGDAVFSFIGHGWLGISGLLFYSVDEYEPDWANHGSAIASNMPPDPQPPFTVDYIADLPPGALSDLHLAVLDRCETAESGGSVLPLAMVMVAKGADLVISPTGLVFGPAMVHWNTEFWSCASGQYIPDSEDEATIPMCLEYAKIRAHDETMEDGYTEEQATSIYSLSLTAQGQLEAPDYRLNPARYGRSTD